MAIDRTLKEAPIAEIKVDTSYYTGVAQAICLRDLVGPILPPSEKGHRYILALLDYATRYAEAVPLKNIETETVTKALLHMYSRLEIPEDVLSDLGTQFVSKCM